MFRMHTLGSSLRLGYITTQVSRCCTAGKELPVLKIFIGDCSCPLSQSSSVVAVHQTYSTIICGCLLNCECHGCLVGMFSDSGCNRVELETWHCAVRVRRSIPLHHNAMASVNHVQWCSITSFMPASRDVRPDWLVVARDYIDRTAYIISGGGTVSSARTFIHPRVCSFICYQTCEHDVLKTIESIFTQFVTSGPRGKGMEQLTLEVRRSKINVTRGRR